MNRFRGGTQLIHDRYTGSTFGPHSQLIVKGHIREGKYTKKHVVYCSVCSADPELFWGGLFLTYMSHLSSGKLPCGCSTTPKWEEDQFQVKYERFLFSNNLKGLTQGPFQGQKTLVTYYCPQHGPRSTSFAKIMCGEGRCGGCSPKKLATKENSIMVDKFMSMGGYPQGTTFSRSLRKTSQGARNYWHTCCGVCGENGEVATSDLKRGNRWCSCGLKDRVLAYIHLVTGDGGEPLALKFGVTSNHQERLYRQNLRSPYKVEALGVWKFESYIDCRDAERSCLNNLQTGVLTKEEMPDGFTETTLTSNYSFIEDIYTNFGGLPISWI